MEELLGLAYLASLEMPHLRRQPLNTARDHCQRGKEHRMPVAWDHLGGNGLRNQPESFRDILLHPRVDMRKRADGSAERGHCYLRPRPDQPRAIPGKFRIMTRKFQPECRRFSVDAVAATNRQRVFVLKGACF